MTDNAAIARRVLSLLDLTELGDDATDDDVRRLCGRAVGPARATSPRSASGRDSSRSRVPSSAGPVFAWRR